MRTLLAALVAAALLVVAPGPALACSCAARSLGQQVAHSDSVGVGKVAWVAVGENETVFAVDFTAVYKGSLGSEEKVFTDAGGCGLTAVEGRRYLFFLTGAHRGRPRADLCRTTPYDAQRIARLQRLVGPAHAPVRVHSTEIRPGKDWFPAWVVWLILVLAGLGGVIAATYLLTPQPPWNRN